MYKKLLPLILLCFTFLQLTAQNDPFWSKYNNQTGKITETDKGVARESFPIQFNLYALDTNLLRQTLFSTLNKSVNNKVIITLPNADGQLEEFAMFEASNFEPDLQSQFPEIRAYSGTGITDKYATVKLSISPQGIQTMIFRVDKPNEFIEPYSKDHTVYAVFKSSRTKGKLPWTCSTEDQKMVVDINSKVAESHRASTGQLKTMRLAQSCNGEYSNYFGATSSAQVGLVLAAYNNTLTRCNGVYEKDLGLHLNLVAGSVNVIYYVPSTDPYTTLSSWNTQLQIALNENLTGPATSLAANNAAYDIGHMFGASGGGGNAGCIGCPCVDGVASGTGATKGRGITSPLDAIPQGDSFDIDFVAHEIGHQLGANHTFSQSSEGFGVNMEVGSGVTVMGYAGITGNDVAPNSIDKYHAASIAQIQAVLALALCPITTNIAANNATPNVNAGLDYTVPRSTPYILTAVGTDANAGDALTYSWEQFNDAGTNTGSASNATDTKVIGPTFISWQPVSSPSRYFPRIQSIIANSPTTSQIGGDVGMNSESLSSVARTLNFRVTVRDNVPYSSIAPIKVGQTNFDDMIVTVSDAAGPFVVNIPSATGLSYTVGNNQTVTWNVANTNIGAVNTPFVDLYLSIDGGNTYPTLLASKVPNDGSETITIPNNVGSSNRLMARGNDNVFFDISNNNFTIAAPVSSFSASFNRVAGEQNKGVCQGANSVSYTIDYVALAGFSGTTNFTATGVPAGTSVSFTPSSRTTSGTVTMTVNATVSTPVGLANIIVNAISGATTKTVPFYLNVGSAPALPTLSTPANNATLQNTSLRLSWAVSAGAAGYDLQVATDSGFTAVVATTSTAASSFVVNGLNQGTEYFWRVRATNPSCSTNFSTVFKFTTGTVTCNTVTLSPNSTISSAGATTTNSIMNIPSGVTIGDLNLIANITHSSVSDLILTLISPSGTAVVVYNQTCPSGVNINATYDDLGATLICGTNPAVSGTIIPLNSITAFNGQSSTGNWTFRVRDNVPSNGGTLNSWGLNICAITPPLSNPEFDLKDINLYPNPNNGDFTVKFNSISTNDIKISVHDMRGREIYKKSFSNVGAFNQNINLNSVQAGIYLVSIEDGAKKAVKRIIID